MNYKIFTVFFIALFFGLFFAGVYVFDKTNITSSGLFTLPSKTISQKITVPNDNILKTRVIPEKRIDTIKTVQSLFDKLECNDLIKTIDETNNTFATATECRDYENGVDKLVPGKITVGYKLKTKYGYLQGCMDFNDICLGTRVLDKHCNNQVNYDIFESEFYKNATQEIDKLKDNLSLTDQQKQQLINDFNLGPNGIDEFLNDFFYKAKKDPRNNFVLLGKEKILDVIRQSIENKVLLKTEFLCFSDNICEFGACKYIEKKNNDLYVGTISEKVKSEKCVNTFEFEVCNAGQENIIKDFNIKVIAGDKTKIIRYYISDKGEISPNGCKLFSDKLLNINSFGLTLNKDISLIVELDSDNEIQETLELNNSKTSTTNTNDNYYFNNTKICESWCFDSDEELEPYQTIFNRGFTLDNSFGVISTRYDECPNTIDLKERTCRPYYNPESYFEPTKTNWFSCNDEAKDSGFDFGFCTSGICQFINLEDGDEIDSCKLKNMRAQDIPIYPFCSETDSGLDKGKKGTVREQNSEDYGITHEDKCLDEKTLSEWTCENEFDWKLKGAYSLNCPKIKVVNDINVQENIITCNTFCESGHCYYKEEYKTTCIDSDNGDFPETAGYVNVTHTLDINDDGNVYSEIEDYNQFDYCESSNTFVEFVCTADNYESVTHDNLESIGKACKQGENGSTILDANNELRKCTEFGDIGIDISTKGWIEYITNVGDNYTNTDICLDTDNTKIIEVYCNGDLPKFDEIKSCPINTICTDGECK